VVREGLEAWAESRPFIFQQDAYHHTIDYLECFGRRDGGVLVILGVYNTKRKGRAAFLFAVYVREELRGRDLHADAIAMATQYLCQRGMPASLPMQECINKVVDSERYRSAFTNSCWEVHGRSGENVVTFG